MLSRGPKVQSGGTAAVAQNQGVGSSGAASSTIPRAPIGHRQPRADQVPLEKNQTNPNDVLAKENAILDRKDEEHLPGLLIARRAGCHPRRAN
jgi:hypothetical protein